jgi:CMP-N-acetylneuraminic acid synthetase
MKPLSIAAIPIRSTSTRVPNKNFRELAGRPLWHWILLHALESGAFDEILLDCDKPELVDRWDDDPDLYQACVDSGDTEVTCIERSEGLLDANGNELLYDHACTVRATYSQDFVITQLFATAPFLRSITIQGCVDTMIACEGDKRWSVLTAVDEAGWYWKGDQPLNYRPDVLPKSQDAMVRKESTGLYSCWGSWVLGHRTRIAQTPIFFPVLPLEALDIDTEFDWEIAEAMAERYLK